MKLTRKIVEIDDELCDGCGQCVPACAEGAIRIVNGKARLIAEKYCDGLGACLGECPNDALRIIEREVDPFDEEAVREHLRARDRLEEPAKATTLPCGCPSARIQTFVPPESCQEANEPAIQKSSIAALSHWPVKIRLVPPTAPFLKGAHLLVVADCVPVVYPSFHQGFLKGRVVMAGCPKFDDVQEYLQKFVEIFKAADIQSITVPIMEVPCCWALPMVLNKAMEEAKKESPMELVVISHRGKVLRRKRFPA